ncbi:hypothetical protein PC119_g19207 [Phytophthora cactorum]|nr:hypothetical protein PC119_g19207 [Phytophthora cactorum]
MVKRYFELLEFIDVEDDDIMELLPPRRQTSDCAFVPRITRHRVRVESAARSRRRLARRPIVDLVQILYTAQTLSLAVCSNRAGRRSRKLGGAARSFVERLRKRRRLYEERVEYEQLKSIPPTSNVVEPFFSVARVTLGHQRHGLLPRTLETLLFLRENRSYWDASTVDSLQ